MKASSFTAHVDREMQGLNGLARNASFLKNYYRTELEVLGPTLPTQRNRHAKGYAALAGKSREEQAQAWLGVWNESSLLESMSQAVFFFETWADEREKAKRKLLRAKLPNLTDKAAYAYDPLWPYLLKMVARIENWVHSDGLSGLISAAVEERPERYATLVKWSQSSKPWYRRQAIVSLHFYSRFRAKPFPSTKTLPLIESLLDDDHFYVQRGVGWALRECYNVDPKTTMRFLEKQIHRVAPPGYFAAVEKLGPADKALLKELRKTKRLAGRAKRSKKTSAK